MHQIGKSLLIFFLISSVGLSIKAQDACHQINSVLVDQAQVDEFSNKYPNCTEIPGNLIIAEAEVGAIQDLAGLSQITHITGNLEINGNRNLLYLIGLENLATIGGSLIIVANNNLREINSLQNLTHIGKSCRIESNSNLLSLAGLENILVIPGDLSITDNDRLPNMHGLAQLSEVGEHLGISSNAGLLNLEGLDKIKLIGNELYIKDNAVLESLEGLQNIDSIRGDLIVDNNPRLSSFRGLRNLLSIGENTLFINNANIANFNGLQNLRSFGGLVQFFNNTSLTSLQGIDSVAHESITELVILQSPDLSECAVNSICNYLENPDNLATVRDNGYGCQSVEEVLEFCKRSGLNSQPGVRVNTLFFPNPTPGPVFVRGGKIKNARYVARDVAGQLVSFGNIEGNSFDLNLLPAGMYLVELQEPNRSATERIIKIE